ncbi:hypothetical protein C7456_10881 [Fulvimonas soli]|uniref:Lectin n=1 Tax=Fulvimonas soli TaxID=155197 RepID=A0A316HWF2_9GAMM|nr:lectin [Fulvimonas soli]PWK85786.1 hypothetical protein C7456_10881 [Fulvimonas soli]
MIRRLPLLAALALAGGCGQAPAPAESASHESPRAAASAATPAAVASAATSPAAGTGLARYDGYGDLRLGMDEAAFRAAWQGALDGRVDPAGGCGVLWPRGAARDVGFMFEQGRFVRYDVATAKVAAPGGGAVGMAAARVRALYGRVEAEPHKYEAGASTLRVAAPDGRGALVFETDAQGRIARWRVGLPPAVDYVEGCG